MNWYMVKMIFRIDCGTPAQKIRFEEQLRIIEASDAEAAFKKACKIAADETSQELIAGEQKIKWSFVNLSELYRLSTYLDGAELYSSMNETDNSEVFEGMIHHRANLLKQNIEKRILEIY